MPLFETQGLCKVYRSSSRHEVRAVEGVSLRVERGSFLVVTGPSGSGKTTLLALLGGLERPSSGQILFDGHEMTRCSDVELTRIRRQMGFIFQDFALIPSLTALENITYPLIPRKVPRSQRTARACALLGQFGLEGKGETRAGDLSGGEQQRTAIARALAGHPDVVLADEPTSNLDEETTRVLLSVLQALHQEGKTIVLASHDPRVIALATAGVELVAGRRVS